MNTAEQYIEDVLSGSIPAGSWIVKAFKRHRRDLETGAERGLHFDPTAGQDVIYFCENFCNPAESESFLVLMPWEHALLHITYGWKRADGTRRFRKLYLEIAKKNGKTGLAAALSLYHLSADGEKSPRVFIAAVTREQAKECFLAACGMRQNSDELCSVIGQTGKGDKAYALHTKDLGRMSMMTRDAKSQDGKLVSAAIMDELHRWPNTGGIYSIIRYGSSTKKQPLMIELTTAGASAGGTSPCWLEREYGTKILDGVLEDDEFAPFIFCMDDKDDWKNPENWIKSNPSVGHILDLERLKTDFHEVQGKPTDLGEFKRFRLNIWSNEAENPAIEIERWDACCREPIENHPDARRLRKESLEELAGRTSFWGLDLAPKLDTSSLIGVFPPMKTTENWRILEFFWCPQADVAKRVKRDRVPYDLWSNQGFLTLTPGNLTDVRYIAEQITELSKTFDMKEVAYDAAWSSELIRMLGESGFPMDKFVDFPQNNNKMNPGCIEFMRKVNRAEFAHDNNPIMRWQMSNLRWNVNKGNSMIKPDKSSKREKIDGPAALIMALSRAIDPENIIKPPKKFWVVSS